MVYDFSVNPYCMHRNLLPDCNRVSMYIHVLDSFSILDLKNTENLGFVHYKYLYHIIVLNV